jgi:uncharacterized protein YfaS (alpha-2-macroglobulin family)
MKQSCSVILFVVSFFASGLYAQERATTNVAEIVICTSVVNKQPVGVDSVFAADVKQLSCYTKIVSQVEQSEVSHVWFYKDRQMAKIDLKVKGRTFHTWSTKTIIPTWKGDWRVEVQDSAGNVLSKISFKIR